MKSQMLWVLLSCAENHKTFHWCDESKNAFQGSGEHFHFFVVPKFDAVGRWRHLDFHSKNENEMGISLTSLLIGPFLWMLSYESNMIGWANNRILNGIIIIIRRKRNDPPPQQYAKRRKEYNSFRVPCIIKPVVNAPMKKSKGKASFPETIFIRTHPPKRKHGVEMMGKLNPHCWKSLGWDLMGCLV